MRLLHTADWHLGRILHGQHLVDDQRHVLDQIVEYVRATRPDAVLLAGDVYDRSVPPTEAIELLDDVLTRIVLELGTPIIGISGNHDSASRLGFGSRLMAGRGLHLIGRLRDAATPVLIPDPSGPGPVAIYAVPYVEPVEVRHLLGGESLPDHDAAWRAMVAHLDRQRPVVATRRVLVAHAFVAGGTASESERPLSIGGADQVNGAVFDGFDYVALGHLHRPQQVGRLATQYSGSPMKYSFSEADDHKSVTLVELAADGGCTVERLPLTARRDMRVVRGYFKDLLVAPTAEVGAHDDYLKVVLRDEGTIFDAMPRLREVFPNILHLEREILQQPGGEARPGGNGDHRRIRPLDLFRDFYTFDTGEAPSDAMLARLATLLDDMERREREGEVAVHAPA